jgi:hypothetical protein
MVWPDRDSNLWSTPLEASHANHYTTAENGENNRGRQQEWKKYQLFMWNLFFLNNFCIQSKTG